MKVFDNFNAEMPYIDANEDFSSVTLEPGVSSLSFISYLPKKGRQKGLICRKIQDGSIGDIFHCILSCRISHILVRHTRGNYFVLIRNI